MQPETTTAPERWHVEIRLLEGTTEHAVSSHAPDHDGVRSVVAGAIETLDELAGILSDAKPAPDVPAGTYRNLWHWRIQWTDATGVDHVSQSWTSSGSACWLEVADGIMALLDLRAILRQVRGPRAPRWLGEDAPTFDDRLAAYDAKAAASALSDAELAAHMKTRRPPGTPG